MLAYFGYAMGDRPVRLKSVTVDDGKIRLHYTRRDDPWLESQGPRPRSGGAWATTRS